MGLLAPIGLALFALAVPLIALYLLKQKRENKVVSSTLLWAKVVQDLQARHPFQKLRASLLLLLQLLVLALLAVAVARPVIRATIEQSRSVAIVVDASASMLATDADGETRFDAARDAARELLRNLRSGDKAMLIVAGRAARTAKALTAEHSELVKALDQARAEETRGEMRDAVLLAGSALKPFAPAGEIHIFSDGGGEELPAQRELGAKVLFHGFGSGAANQGITGLDVVRGKEDRIEVFATVENADDKPAKRFLTLSLDAKPVASRELEIPAGGEASVVFREVLPPGKLALDLGGSDDLECDDSAYAIVVPRQPIGVAIVGPSHAALERALEKAGDVEIFAGPASAFVDSPRFRLVIFDGVIPPGGANGGRHPMIELPPKPVLLFGVDAPVPGVKVGDEVQMPEITGWERDHPLLRFVDLGGVAIARARPLTLDGPGRPLIRSDKGLLALESRSRRDPIIAIGIGIRESSWAAEEAFPVFILNVLQLVKRSGGELGPDRIQAGEPLPVRAPDAETEVALVRPDGERVVRRARDGRADFLETGLAGFYTVEAGGRTALVAANLLDRTETAIAPRAAIASGAETLKAEKSVVPANREVWRWLALGALVVIVVEWWAFHRRI